MDTAPTGRMVELIWEDRGVLRRLTGHVTSEELDASARELQGDERLDDLRAIVHDFTGATDVSVTQDEIEFMAVRASIALQRNAKVRIAFVGNHPVVHALIEAFAGLGRPSQRCHRFDTLAEARRFTSAAR